MTEKVKLVICPSCGTEVAWLPENTWRPFCSQRCKLIDLGDWAAERYKVPVVEQDGLDDLEPRG